MAKDISHYRWNSLNPLAFPLKIVATDMQKTVPKHTHDFHELVIFMRGSAVHTIYQKDGTQKSYSVYQGDVFAIRLGEKHSFENGNSAYYYNIIFQPKLFHRELAELQQIPRWNTFFGDTDSTRRMKSHLSQGDRTELYKNLQTLSRELTFQAEGFRLFAKTMFLEILMKILRTSQRPLPQHIDMRIDTPILRCINQIEDAPELHYSLQEQASQSNMCVALFTKKFRKATGCSMLDYILQLRLEKAENLLLTTEAPLKDIAEKCGFYDTNYLIKAFRRFRNITPGVFRSRQKALRT